MPNTRKRRLPGPLREYIRKYTRIYARKFSRARLPMNQLVLVLGTGSLLIAWLVITLTQHYAPSQGNNSVVGAPTINASFIDQVLEHYHSPASGKGQALYDYGVKYNIDPAYALAFFMHESTFGTKGVATVTHSLGNIRATSGHSQYQGYRAYNSWEEGFEDWYRLIANLYVERWGLSTIDQIIPVYAPASDHNNERLYIQSVQRAVDRWRSGSIDI